MTWGQYLFSFSGRLNRARYWAFLGVSILFFIVVFAVTFAAFGFPGPGRPTPHLNPIAAIIAGLFLLVVYFGFLVASLAVAAKRLHDRAKSGLWILVFYVLPAVLNLAGFGLRASGAAASGMLSVIAFAFSIWGFVEVGCLRGTDGPNRFGPDPLRYEPDVAAATFN
jgi:uncharacterized membrane protein YhaH (DUF805 family)